MFLAWPKASRPRPRHQNGTPLTLQLDDDGPQASDDILRVSAVIGVLDQKKRACFTPNNTDSFQVSSRYSGIDGTNVQVGWFIRDPSKEII